MTRSSRHGLFALLLTACLATTAACSSPPETAPNPTTAAVATTTTRTPTPSPTTTTRAALPGLTGSAVLAAKIDHTTASYPRLGISEADVVYVEPVEAGLTRLLAVFSSRMPAQIGPIRSARESDVDLLANYGRVAFAFSGASAYTLGVVGRGAQVNLSNDASGEGFFRAGNRRSPYNVIGNTGALLARAGGSVPPGNTGFGFGPAATGGLPTSSISTAWQSSRIDLKWDPASGTYLVTSDGRPEVDAMTGKQVGASTVVVQYVNLVGSPNRDVNGQMTPVVQVVGQGPAVVARSGVRWDGQWSRPDAASPTAFTAGGVPIPMAQGSVWVLLVPLNQQVTSR